VHALKLPVSLHHYEHVIPRHSFQMS